jgi:TolA-binding protein
VANFITDHFVPVKIHIKERPKDFERFGAQWTPTVILAEPDGTERYRFEGYMPAEDYLSQLQLGLAKAAFSRGQFAEAEGLFRAVVDQHPKSEAAPEAVYWAGVSAYKATGKPESLGRAGAELQQKYPESTWAKKGSVWIH